MNKITATRFIRIATITTLAMAMTLTACKRKNDGDTDPDPDLNTERDISNADNDNNSLLSDIDKAFDNGATTTSLRMEAGYATLIWSNFDTTINSSTYNKKLVINYNGIAANDGQTRNGSAIVFYSGDRVSETFKSFSIFVGTKVGGRSISGIKTVTQKVDGNTNTWTFDIAASGTVMTIAGKTITYSSSRTRVRTGISTLANLMDDAFSFSGSWTGTNADGQSVNANVSSPLQLSYSCHSFREITAGKIDFINNSTGTTRSIDYGSESCDGVGTFINAKGRAFTFNFHR